MDVDGGSKTGLAGIAFGMAALLLALATLWQAHGNRDLQRQVADGQQRVAKAQAMANVDTTLVQLLAKAAVERDDPALRSLLERNGVRLNATPNASVQPGMVGNGQ